jgi:hypothetical protein
MIITTKGRHRSVRTSDEELRLIEDQLANLSDAERELLLATVAEMERGDDSLLEFMNEHLYRWKPVTMEQFLDDEYYLGQSTQTLFPKLREDLIELFDKGNGYREVVLAGSIGYGKSTFASIAMCRTLYELSCLRSPQLAYGLSPGSEMVVAVLSKSLHLARTVMKTAIEDKLKISPYFEENYKPKFGRDNSHFPNNVMLSIGSCMSQRVLGMNVFAGAMDEANFMTSKGQQITSTGTGRKSVAMYDMAEKVYASLVRRIKSRFLRAGGDLPGLMLLISSAATLGSFTDRKIKDSMNDPTVFVRDYATWDVKPSDHFSGERFKVVVGTSSLRSRIVPPEEAEEIDEEFLSGEGAHILNVPVEYYEDFERDLENSIRDIAGVGTHAISAFIHRIEKIDSAISGHRHPFSVQTYIYGQQGEFMWDVIANPGKRKLPGGYDETFWRPKRHPDKPRHVHIDPSLSGDCTGIAMGYIDRWVEVIRRNENGEEYNDVAPRIVVEFMLQIEPPPGEQIYLPDVRRLIYELMDHGFSIGGFTCDTYQSAEMIQQMKARGVKSDILSVDRTTDPYEALKAAIYEDRIEFYSYEPFLNELKALEYDRIRGKVDHPVAGSKDVSDAVAGMVAGLIRSAKRMPIGPVEATQGLDKGDDMTWVTNGKVPVGANLDIKPRGGDKGNGPLPMLIG